MHSNNTLSSVLMIGTDPRGKGGVASVISVLIQEGFFEKYAIKYVPSHVQGPRFDMLCVFVNALWQVLMFGLTGKEGIVHVHSASGGSFYRKSILLAMARMFGCKTIFHLHGAEFQQFSREKSGSMIRWWIRHTLESSSTVIALSKSWADFITQYASKAKVVVVANSVKLNALSPVTAKEAARILFLGRVGKRKGVFELLKAVALLKTDYPSIKLILGGDGDLSEAKAIVEDLQLEESVEFLGWVGLEQKALELARASIFTLPSYDEGLPMAMLEAMSASKAIVVTAIGGIPEAVNDGENGLLIPPGDIQALYFALRKLLDDPLLQKTIGNNARKTIEKNYSTEVMIAKLSTLYEELGGVIQN